MKKFATGHYSDMEQFLRDYLPNKLGYEVVHKDVPNMTEEEFAESRCNGFGASDSAVLLKVAFSSKKIDMKTIEQLMQEKIDNYWDPTISEKGSVRKGKELEPFIIKKLETALNANILKPRDTYFDYKTGLATNFDGVMFELISEDSDEFNPIPTEVKYVTTYGRHNYNYANAFSEDDEELEELLYTHEPNTLTKDKGSTTEAYIKSAAMYYGIPSYYYTQLQQQIDFTGATHGYLVAMDELDWKLFIFKIPRDQFVIDELKKVARLQYLKLATIKQLRIDLDDL